MIDYEKIVFCEECEKALTCEKWKANEEIDACYDGIKGGDT